MATRIKTGVGDLYEQDLYAWSKAQADLLRAGRFAELDLERSDLPVERARQDRRLRRQSRHSGTIAPEAGRARGNRAGGGRRCAGDPRVRHPTGCGRPDRLHDCGDAFGP